MNLRTLVTFLVFSVAIAGQASADDVVVDGRFGPGALYRLVRPTNWNGDLVLYAHGDVLPGEPVVLPPAAAIIVGLLAPQGFAVAFSSFSENGFAVKDGAQRTYQLLEIFTSKFGRPVRVYIAGASMGGLIAIKLAETYPGTFAGALPACAVSGGTRRELDYSANVRALFDFLYPGVLPGSAVELPPGTDITLGIVGPAVAAMTANPAGASTIAAIDQTPVPFANLPELILSIATALLDNALGLIQMLPRTHGHPFFDNRSTSYTSGTLPAALLFVINAGIERFDAWPSALEYLDHYYEPSGDLRIPMLMLSDSRDPVVPGFNQTAYRDAVAVAGNPSLLVRREVPAYGHCDFTPLQLGTAFADLVLWVELGITPVP
jgi:pimeloyl-ACP methyl ester carboxylesterase